MRRIWQREWIRWPLWLTSIGCIVGTMAWLVSRLPEKPQSETGKAPLFSQQTELATSALKAFPNDAAPAAGKEKLAPEWCEISKTTQLKKPDPIFATFRRWLDEYSKTNDLISSHMVKSGVLLAKQRNTALKKLIQDNPRMALSQIVPARTRKHLPGEVQAELAEIVSGVGDLNVLHACFGPSEGYRQTIYRTLKMRDGRIQLTTARRA